MRSVAAVPPRLRAAPGGVSVPHTSAQHCSGSCRHRATAADSRCPTRSRPSRPAVSRSWTEWHWTGAPATECQAAMTTSWRLRFLGPVSRPPLRARSRCPARRCCPHPPPPCVTTSPCPDAGQHPRAVPAEALLHISQAPGMAGEDPSRFGQRRSGHGGAQGAGVCGGVRPEPRPVCAVRQFHCEILRPFVVYEVLSGFIFPAISLLMGVCGRDSHFGR